MTQEQWGAWGMEDAAEQERRATRVVAPATDEQWQAWTEKEAATASATAGELQLVEAAAACPEPPHWDVAPMAKAAPALLAPMVLRDLAEKWNSPHCFVTADWTEVESCLLLHLIPLPDDAPALHLDVPWADEEYWGDRCWWCAQSTSPDHNRRIECPMYIRVLGMAFQQLLDKDDLLSASVESVSPRAPDSGSTTPMLTISPPPTHACDGLEEDEDVTRRMDRDAIARVQARADAMVKAKPLKMPKVMPPAARKARAKIPTSLASPPKCPTTPAPAAASASAPSCLPWTRPPPQQAAPAAPAPHLMAKAAAKGKASVPPMTGPSGSTGGMRRPRFSFGSYEERHAILNRFFWRCVRCGFKNFSDRKQCWECFLSADGHVLFDPASQHAAPAEGFDGHGAAQGADTPGASSSGMNDTTGFLSPPVYNRFPMGKAPAPKPTGAAATVQNVAEGDGPDKKRRRTDPSEDNSGTSHPAAAGAGASITITDPDAALGGLQADAPHVVERCATAPCGIAPPTLPPMTSSLQPEFLEWFGAAPPALQGIASSLLTSYATVVRARASGLSRGDPSAGIATNEPTVAPAERVGHLRASPERAFRSWAA